MTAEGHAGSAPRCPSAQPDMAEAQVLGVVGGKPDAPRVAYLNADLPVGPDVLALAEDVPPTRVFRFAARCEERKCSHYDGTDCRLASRIVAMMTSVTDVLPPCVIRRNCRWYAQEGAPACFRCPQVVTFNPDPDRRLRAVALPAEPATGRPETGSPA
jgi:hypothetical protein